MPPDPTPLPAYLEWRRDPASACLPAPALPGGRRSFGCPHQAEARALHRAGGNLLASMRDLAGLSEALRKKGAKDGTVPAGYTYLGQLLAHDLCAATEGVFDYPLNGAALPVTQPAALRRALPLHLETLFGPIADARPLPGLHRFRPSPKFPLFVADLLRAPPVTGKGRTVALLPDTRNDDTPMVAQLSALFIAYAARAAAALEAAGHAPDTALTGARVAVARLWHRILRQDYLPRLCLPGLADLPADAAGPDMPVELTNAVLRFGHWMVRSQYALNDETVTVSDLLHGVPDIGARRAVPGGEDFWRIDWRRFFALDPALPPQCALTLHDGPAAMFSADMALPEEIEIHSGLVTSDNDLTLRDIARSLDGGLQRVSVLARRFAGRLRKHHPGWLLWRRRDRQAMLAGWAAARGLTLPRHVVTDPPLYLHVLVEAGDGPAAAGFGNGARLGALGSALLSSTLAGALERAEAALPAAPDPGPDFARPATMPDLIRFLST